MALEEYSRKRKFSATPEPKPETSTHKRAEKDPLFCVQRHDATNLHYDFRLEVDGVLASWAVPKGPSMDPARKPLAVHVEDHPLDYARFEGTIPEGNYGAGSVMLWDIGVYEVLGDATASEQIKRGDFKFALHGHKLNGSFAIVRMKPRPGRKDTGREWLLIKKPDEFALAGWNVEDHARSVLTQRTQEQIAAGEDLPGLDTVPGAKKAAMPKHLEPMMATLAAAPPAGDNWVYEVKWDGVRALCFVDAGELHIESRAGNRCEQQYPELHDLPRSVRAKQAILDGEIVVMDEQGRGRFQLIQPRISVKGSGVQKLAKDSPATLILFDLLYLDGYDLRGVPLTERKALLEQIVAETERWKISKVFSTDGQQMLEAARNLDLEGFVAKEPSSVYESGKRSRSWWKVKIVEEQEFVIAGYTKGEREYFGALVLGVYEGTKLRHAGQVGTGFDHATMKAIHSRMKPLVANKCPLDPVPRMKDVIWLEPELVCQVRFHEWTHDHMLRAPVYVGLREDKPAREVIKEEPVKAKAPVKKATKKATNKALSGTPSNEPAAVSSHRSTKPVMDSAQLQFSGKEALLEVDGHQLKFTNLNKVYYPAQKYTKRDVLEFYDRVSSWLLPHLRDRPLSLKRYPNGIEASYFFQKDTPEYYPDWIQREPIQEHEASDRKKEKMNHYVVANNRATLLYLANLGCIDQNPWLSRVGSLDHPDWVLIDLDPVECPFDLIVEAAQIVHQILERFHLRGYPKTTGGDGLHIYVPLDPIYSFDQARSFAEILATLAAHQSPELFTAARTVNKRKKGTVYFDWMQIGTGKTVAAPYVLRAYDHAPVATPLEWKEVKRGVKPTDFNITNAIERFEKVGDLFSPVLAGGQRIEDALRHADG
jgi:bifunctional non-homologous end joining protein LigD